MRRLKPYFDVFVIGGFVTSLFYGFLNPLYVSVILARLDIRVIAVGSFMSSAFPVFIGALLGRKRIFDRLYAALPVIMIVELVAAVASALAAAVDLAAYYLVSMFILGVFSASVIYLMQRIKEIAYRRSRAAFDRRMGMADALGTTAGSLLAFIGIEELQDPVLIAVLFSAQTVIVYGLFLVLYRKKPTERGAAAEKEPHPWPRVWAFGVNAA